MALVVTTMGTGFGVDCPRLLADLALGHAGILANLRHASDDDDDQDTEDETRHASLPFDTTSPLPPFDDSRLAGVTRWVTPR
jgi:hypothetical protein